MKKNKCCKKSSSSDETTSYGYCCPKYPKCCCVKENHTPIYYPNNCKYPCVTQCPPYPSRPPYLCPPQCSPCPPYTPFPPSQCETKYTSNNSIIVSSSTLSANSPNIYICNPVNADIILTLPQISSLSSYSYTKMFVISNISPTYTVSINPTVGDTLTQAPLILSQGDSATLYSVFMSSGSFWVVA